MASNRAHWQMIFQNENLDIHHKVADGRTTIVKKAPKKGAVGNRKALNDISNLSSLHHEASARKKNHQKEEFSFFEESFLHDHDKCVDAQRKGTECNFLDLVLPEHDSVTSVALPKSKKELAGLDGPPKGLEAIEELPMSEFSAWLDSPTSPSSPFAWKFESVEFVLKPEIDD